MEKQHSGRSSFSGKLGFVLSAAGASVGLGNIWRFPYLAAKYGGGIFLLIYILLAVTFGYTMIMAETALGRMTRKSPVGAFAASGKGRWRAFGGWINAVIPILIVPYYSVIGGWVIKYLVGYITGHGSELAQDGYFSSFIANGASVENRIPALYPAYTGHHFCRCPQWCGACFPDDDAGTGGVISNYCSLFSNTARCAGRSEVLFSTESGQFFMDDSGYSHGPDVLFFVHRNGYFSNIRLLHEKRCVH